MTEVYKRDNLKFNFQKVFNMSGNPFLVFVEVCTCKNMYLLLLKVNKKEGTKSYSVGSFNEFLHNFMQHVKNFPYAVVTLLRSVDLRQIALIGKLSTIHTVGFNFALSD